MAIISPKTSGRKKIRLAAGVLVAYVVAGIAAGFAVADPSNDYDPVAHYDRPQRLPVITPAPSGWQPQFPFPFDQTQRFVTAADISAERDMCQWYDAQYDILKHQVEGLNDHVVRNNGNFETDGVAEQVDIVVANLDQSLDFLTPRASALTQSTDHSGDVYSPIYGGDAFYGLWQQMTNVNNGLKARQPNWFTAPSFHLMQYWGSKIHRSHVCS
jgi:hypothetical protein